MPNYENTDTQLLEAIAIAAHHQLIAWDTAAGEPRLPAWHEATPDQQIVMRRNVRDLLLGAKPMDPRHPLFGEVVREMAKQGLEKLGNLSAVRAFDIPLGEFQGPRENLPEAPPLAEL